MQPSSIRLPPVWDAKQYAGRSVPDGASVRASNTEPLLRLNLEAETRRADGAEARARGRCSSGA